MAPTTSSVEQTFWRTAFQCVYYRYMCIRISLCVYMYIYVYTYVYMCVCICACIRVRGAARAFSSKPEREEFGLDPWAC